MVRLFSQKARGYKDVTIQKAESILKSQKNLPTSDWKIQGDEYKFDPETCKISQKGKKEDKKDSV